MLGRAGLEKGRAHLTLLARFLLLLLVGVSFSPHKEIHVFSHFIFLNMRERYMRLKTVTGASY